MIWMEFEICSMGRGCGMSGMGVTDGEWVIWMKWQMLMEVGGERYI